MTTPTSDDLRLDRLPAWAREEIKDLRLRLATANAKLGSGPEDSDTVADPYGPLAGGIARPLGKGTRVRFLLDPSDPQPGIHVWTENKALMVMAERGVYVQPVSSNMIQVWMEQP